MRGQLCFMPLQLDQIVEWIDTVQLTGMDEAHEQIGHVRAFQRLVEQRVLAIQNRFLQTALKALLSRGAPALERNSVSFGQYLSR